ncbi:MAG: hypothetical protein AAFZ04_15670 [Pseudomonadota bacterium]
MSDKTKLEFEAFQQVHRALVELDEDAQARVLSSVSTLLGIGAVAQVGSRVTAAHSATEDVTSEVVEDVVGEQAFDEFAELYAATSPTSHADKALVAGYWLQVCKVEENFSGQAVNNELNHLGHKVPNITNAMSSLNDSKPQLVLQLRKSGKSQQARKTYKLSAEGIKRVKEMIGAT